ncbi:putative protein OS=Rhodanobacter lindaniclasticus OX=75310 GN=B1991_13775 PE=4 SV=1 [Rhodanobacter lindaniclasticus]
MSDFLDRLAARAIGSETMLAPRLPSLFEPLQRAPLLSSVDDVAAPSRRAAAPERHTVPVAEPLRPSQAVTPLPPASPCAASLECAAAPMQTVATAPAPPPASLPSPAVAATRVVEWAEVSPSRTSRPTEAAPVTPRQVRVAPEHIETAPAPARGALVPDPAPVFAASRATAAPARYTAAARHAQAAQIAQTASHHVAASEPIVHVSIGRLEVRAAPAAVPAPRRRDGPQPSSLDDYLRQRGKAPP